MSRRIDEFVPDSTQGPIQIVSDPYVRHVDESTGLRSALELFLPDELFEGVMQGMVDSVWLRERAETIAAQGGPYSNEKAAALFEAADAAAASASADAAP